MLLGLHPRHNIVPKLFLLMHINWKVVTTCYRKKLVVIVNKYNLPHVTQQDKSNAIGWNKNMNIFKINVWLLIIMRLSMSKELQEYGSYKEYNNTDILLITGQHVSKRKRECHYPLLSIIAWFLIKLELSTLTHKLITRCYYSYLTGQTGKIKKVGYN